MSFFEPPARPTAEVARAKVVSPPAWIAPPRRQRLEHVGVGVVGGQDQHPHPLQPPGGRDLPGGLQPVEHRHADVHQHHVGPVAADLLDGVGAVGRRRGPWKNLDEVEYATLEWVDWFNQRRLLEPIGHLPPAEFEATYWRKQAPDSIDGLKQPSLR